MPLFESITNAFGKRTRAFLSDGINDVLLNVVVSISKVNQIEVTSHAIQDGADVSDNINPKSDEFTIQVILTDDDWDLLSISGFINKTIDERLKILEAWKAVKQLVTYYGHSEDIEDVAMTNITQNKSKETGSGLGLSISLKKITVATAQTAEISNVNQKGNTPKGKNSKQGDPTPKKRVSILKGLAG
jgi:hypothetical protein